MIYKHIVAAVLSIAGVVLLVMIIGSFSPEWMHDTSCSIHNNFIRYVPLPKWAKPSLPEYCEYSVKSEAIHEEYLSTEKLANYILSCWEKTGMVDYGKDVKCYEIGVDEPVGTLDEQTITEYIMDHERCEDLQNSVLESGGNMGCGEKNQLLWKASVKKNSLIIIKYVHLAGRIEVL